MNYDNPFPGMNPYLEHRDIWPDFHDDLAAQLRGVLGPQLPDRYRIALQRRVEVAEPFGDPPGLALMIPDALVTSEPGGPASGRSVTAVMEATVTVAAPPDGASAVRVRMPREIRVTWLRVERAPNREVVTIDDAIPDAPRHSQAILFISKVVTIGTLYAVKGLTAKDPAARFLPLAPRQLRTPVPPNCRNAPVGSSACTPNATGPAASWPSPR